MRIRKLISLSLGHMTSDLYPGMLSPLLPLLLPRYNLTMAKAGILIMVLQVFSNLAQPIMGVINDNRPKKYVLWLGLLISATPFCFLLQLGRVELMLIALAISGLGVGIFHPVAAVAAGLAAKESRGGLSMAIFSSGGAAGFMVAPLVIVIIVEILGEQYMPLVAVPAILMIAYFLKNRDIEVSAHTHVSLREWFAALQKNRRELILLWIISSFRAVVQLLFGSFLPLLAIARGASFAASAYFLSASLLAAMVGMFVGGHMSDIHGRKKIMSATMLITAPLLYAFLSTTGALSTVFLLLGMATLSSTIPVNILLAQHTSPKGPGIASSLVMGLSFGLAALMAPTFGALADNIGIEAAMKTLTLLPLLGGLTVFMLKKE